MGRPRRRAPARDQPFGPPRDPAPRQRASAGSADRRRAAARGPTMTTDSDRSLLFGLLALQNGLIDQADLIAAFQLWSKGRTRPLAQVLIDRGALNEADRTLLDALVSRHVEKH